ncbi:MAG: copper resistance protein CopC [Caulobacterales bacterium 68-7]|jgi:copper resistance protein C|uniref:copper homeostasis periplasmic binding protein CopC n=1 Tax=Phenylobacterium sp. TaxID=1871053 RepID=UPI00095BC21D|nr:copper homeostasis periplasmic binding protein CopC [Phenylobacterium sp.]MBN9319273.1 copper homeostasis periplasmic binding protein CopC [Caulobacterales bacterium]MDO8410878.1 copper homeostasis periplasmic binding protein CopC [Phenylobacterium sp.]OJU11831.1 MAG: copper resistance protein CopC [Caulobacterales bacterium 68-7]OYW91501.1 MAG: copper resistance protein CopC [Caulobacterales bacterium 32-67-6]
MRNRYFGLAALSGATALLATSPAWAHAQLVSSNPAANAAVAAAPKVITLTFNEKLVPAFSKFELTMPEHGGMKVPVKTTVSTDGKSITGTPEAALAKGAYKIVWTAASADGHKMNGEVAFKVG